jgi:hypothetical protein
LVASAPKLLGVWSGAFRRILASSKPILIHPWAGDAVWLCAASPGRD